MFSSIDLNIHASKIDELNKDLTSFLSSMYDEMMIVHPSGTIIFVSDYKLPPLQSFKSHELIGTNLFDMKKKDVLAVSILPTVIQEQKQTVMIKETDCGKVLVTATPLFDSENRIEKVVIASRHFPEQDRLTYNQNMPKAISSPLNQELHHLQTKISNFFIFKSEAMNTVFRQVRNVASVSTSILLIGESGVGKEIVARAIHHLSKRSNKPFIKVNCGAIPENLFESELFGYTKGAFTGADPKGKPGYFEMADSGIIFLDEISEMPLNMQVKLLRVIQERELIPVGGTEPKKIDIQIIAATNKDLEQQVESKKFREDLYYRLNVVPIHIPPLRERIEDIPFLSEHFINIFNSKYEREVILSVNALNLLKIQPWHGNVRELENFIERLVVTAENRVIDTEDIKHLLPNKKNSSKSMPILTDIIPLKYAFDQIEEQLIIKAVEKYKSLKLAAQALEISQPTMTRKYQKIKNKLLQANLPINEQFKIKMLEEKIEVQLRSIASVTANSLNAEEVKGLLKDLNKENPFYQKLKNRLTNIREIEGNIEWNYIFTMNKDGEVINLVCDEKLQIEPGNRYIGPPEIMDAFVEGMKGKITITSIYEDKFGKWMSSIAPIKDESGNVLAILGSDFSLSYVDSQISNYKKLLNI